MGTPNYNVLNRFLQNENGDNIFEVSDIRKGDQLPLNTSVPNNAQFTAFINNQFVSFSYAAMVAFIQATAGTPGVGNLDPFDAKVDGVGTNPGTYVTVAAAIADGKSVINKLVGTSEPLITVSRNIFIYFSGNSYKLSTMQGFVVSANCMLSIDGPGVSFSSAGTTTGATVLTGTGDGTGFISGAGAVSIKGIYFVQGAPAGLIGATLKATIEKCQFETIGNDSNYVNLQAFGSWIKECFFKATAVGSNADNALVIGNGCYGEDITYYNGAGSTGTHITVEAGGRLSKVKGTAIGGVQGFPFVILNQGYLEEVITAYPTSAVITNDGGILANSSISTPSSGFAPATASVTLINARGLVSKVNFTGATINIDSSASNTFFFDSNSTSGTYTDGGTNTHGIGNTGDLAAVNDGSYDPFTAKATTFDQLITATNSGKKVINVDGDITFQGDIATNFDTVLFLTPGSRLDMSTHSWDKRSNALTIMGSENNVLTWASTTGNSPFIDTVGNGFSMLIQNCLVANIGTAANTPICDPDFIPMQLKNCGFSDNGETNSGVVFAQGGYADNVGFTSADSVSTSEDIAVFENGSWGRKLSIYNLGGSTNSLITIENGARVEGLIGGNGNNLITNNGVLQNAKNNTAPSGPGTLDVNCGTASQTINCLVRNTVIEGSNSMNLGSAYTGSFTINASVTTTLIQGCSGSGGVYTDNGSGTVANGNVGYFPNGGAGANALSPYQAAVDNSGKLANHYIDIGDAYTSTPPKSELYTLANTTETDDITMASADQLFVQIGQNFTSSLGDKAITGSAGNSLTIKLTDGSSVFEWATAGLPFADFDANSTINLIGAAGTFKNTSTSANSYIRCLGILLASDIYLLLNDAAGGGFYTDPYSKLNGIIFVGGGSSCEQGLIAGGGKVSNLVFTTGDSGWKTNAQLMTVVAADKQTVYDTVYVDINAAVVINLNGIATAILRNQDSSYTDAILSLNLYSNTVLTRSYADILTLLTGITGCKIEATTVQTVSLATDNTTQADWVNVTFVNAVTIYGTNSFTNCHFLGGVTVASGATASFVNCDSATALVNSGTVRKAGNDSNIGNDY